MSSTSQTQPIAMPAAVPDTLTVAGGAGFQPDSPFAVAPAAGQRVLTVGADGQFQTIGAAVAAAQNGDFISVAPGTYVNDFADVSAQVTIAGAGGMVNLVATVALPNEKGIFIVDNNCEIDNLTFQGAEIDDSLGGNGAGIRYQGGNLVLNNDAFLDNQNGIMGSAVDNLPQNSFTIENTTFDNNGQSNGPDAGFTHNIYVGTGVASLVAEHDIFERANVGHEFKSRAESNLISNNIFYDGPTGTASYSIDLPDGGSDTVSGNVIEKGPMTQNTNTIHFGGEGIPYAGSALSVTGNHFVNDLGSSAVAVLNQTTLQVSITGNEFDDWGTATMANGSYTQSGNTDQNGAAIAPGSSSTFAGGTDMYDFSGDSASHTVTLTTSSGVRGGGGLLTTYADAGHVTVIGGSGGLNYQEQAGWGGSGIQTQAGAHDTIVALGQDTLQAGGNDSITGGAGNLTAELDGTDSVLSGTGSNAYTVNGTLNLAGQGGSDTVQVNSTTAAVYVHGTEGFFQETMNGGISTLNITQGGAQLQATIGGGAGVQIYNGGMNVTTAGGMSGATLAFGSGTVSAVISRGLDTIHAGSGAATVQVAAAATIYDGAGTLAVFGHGVQGQASVYGGAGAVTIDGDTGNIVFVGGAGTEQLDGVLSNITIDGGAGMLSVTGGSRQSVVGGSGGISYITTGGDDTITTQSVAHDTISVSAASTVLSNGSDRIIDGGGGNSIVTANGHATITGSTGAATYYLNGQDALVGHGYTRAVVGATANDTIAGCGTLTSVTVNGGMLIFTQAANSDGETVMVKGANATITANASWNVADVSLGGQGDGTALYGGHDSVDVLASGAKLWANGGTDTINVSAGGGMIWASGATLTLVMNDYNDTMVTSVHGGAGSIVQAAGSGNLLFTAGSGNVMLGGVSGAETVNAGAGNMTLTGGGGWTRFVGGSGTAQVTLTTAGGRVVFGSGHAAVAEAAGGAAVIYDFVSGHGGGTATVTGFHSGTDQLDFQGVTETSSMVGGGGTTLTLSDGTHVTFVGVTVAGALGHT